MPVTGRTHSFQEFAAAATRQDFRHSGGATVIATIFGRTSSVTREALPRGKRSEYFRAGSSLSKQLVRFVRALVQKWSVSST